MEKHNDIIVSANCHYALPTGLLNFYNLCLQTTVPYLNMVRMFNNGEKNLKLTAIQ